MLHRQYTLTVTADWRVLLPRAWRAAFNVSTPDLVFIAPRDAQCWRLYPGPSWVAMVDSYSAKQGTLRDAASRDLRMIGKADSLFLDTRGRFKIAPKLRDHILPITAPFEALLVGMGSYAELWPRAFWDRHIADHFGPQTWQEIPSEVAKHLNW